MLKELYLAISGKLGNIAELRHTDIFENQYKHSQSSGSIAYPAVFIDFEKLEWDDLGLGSQQGKAVIALHIVRESLAESYAGSCDQEEALKIFDLLDQVHIQMQGYSGEIFGPMYRTQTVKENAAGSLNIYVLRYETIVNDNTAVSSSLYMTDADVHTQYGRHDYEKDSIFII